MRPWRGYRRIDMPVVRRRRSSSEQIQTLAYLYDRSLPPEEVRRRIGQELRKPATELGELADSGRDDEEEEDGHEHREAGVHEQDRHASAAAGPASSRATGSRNSSARG